MWVYTLTAHDIPPDDPFNDPTKWDWPDGEKPFDDEWVLWDDRGTAIESIRAHAGLTATEALLAMASEKDLYADWTEVERIGRENRWQVGWDPHQHG